MCLCIPRTIIRQQWWAKCPTLHVSTLHISAPQHDWLLRTSQVSLIPFLFHVTLNLAHATMPDDTPMANTADAFENHTDESPSIYQKGDFIALGSTSFVERLPSGDIIKTAWPGSDRAAERRRELATEARIYDRLGEHPRIVKKKAWDPDECTLTLEYMPNGTLKDYLESHADVSPNQRCQWITQAAEGIRLLHRSSIIHCDIGPHNFLLDEHLNLKIADFAGSSLDHSPTNNTRPGVRYTPPLASWKVPTTQFDIFGLGSTMYYILTGKAPFHEFQSEEVERRYSAHDFPDLAGMPCAEIIQKCWLQQFGLVDEVIELMKSTLDV